MGIEQVLLGIHIGAGSLALLMASVAVMTRKGHTRHVRSGRVYAISMGLVLVTSAPMALLTSDLFLLLIAFFSFYLVFAGWRFARNRQGHPQPADWIAGITLAVTGIGMGAYALVLAPAGDAQWVTMSVFAVIALGLAARDLSGHRSRLATGKHRIARHLTNMLAGTIATVTAVVVVNVPSNPPWLSWVLPTAVISPFIVYWNRRILGRE